jgi:hypothetical protein
MKRKTLFLLAALVMVMTSLVLVPASVGADTITVNWDGSGDYTTIQAAVDAAAPGDTIVVAAGEYVENVVIDRSLTLLGAEAGVPAGGSRGVRSEQSVITGSIQVTAAASPFTIDGFYVIWGVGAIDVQAATSVIANVEVHADQTPGGIPNAIVYIHGNASDVTVTGNQISPNKTAQWPGDADAINISVTTAASVTVEYNQLQKSSGAGLRLGSTNPGAQFLVRWNAINQNQASGIYTDGATFADMTITANVLSHNSPWGIEVGALTADVSNIHINNNDIHTNAVRPLPPYDPLDPYDMGGVTNRVEADPPLDARGNWWGHVLGPHNPWDLDGHSWFNDNTDGEIVDEWVDYGYNATNPSDPDWEDEGELFGPFPTSVPIVLSVSVEGTTGNYYHARLDWTDPFINEWCFEIEYRDGVLADWKTAGYRITDETTWVDLYLDRGTTYWYRVRAKNYYYTSEWSNVESIWYPTSSGGGGGCFIATAAYGTPMAQELDTLRAFRDEYLLTNPAGEALVETYYSVSPPIADAIADSSALRAIVRVSLVPAVTMSEVALHAPWLLALAALAMISLAMGTLAVRRRRSLTGV